MTGIVGEARLSFPFQTESPFLFAVYHDDHYPPGTVDMAVAPELLRGHNIGSDFGNPAGWSMYHGDQGIPGFPKHPHRGFETITLTRRGVIDHTDSLGNGGRFGFGDVQWMTAGSGISHAEMFPLLSTTADNPLELFQVSDQRSKLEPFATLLLTSRVRHLMVADLDQPPQGIQDGQAKFQDAVG